MLIAWLGRRNGGAYLRILRIGWFGTTQQALQTDKCGLERQNRRPGVLENVKTDRSRLRGDVGVIDLGDELHLSIDWVRLRL